MNQISPCLRPIVDKDCVSPEQENTEEFEIYSTIVDRLVSEDNVEEITTERRIRAQYILYVQQQNYLIAHIKNSQDYHLPYLGEILNPAKQISPFVKDLVLEQTSASLYSLIHFGDHGEIAGGLVSKNQLENRISQIIMILQQWRNLFREHTTPIDQQIPSILGLEISNNLESQVLLDLTFRIMRRMCNVECYNNDGTFPYGVTYFFRILIREEIKKRTGETAVGAFSNSKTFPTEILLNGKVRFVSPRWCSPLHYRSEKIYDCPTIIDAMIEFENYIKWTRDFHHIYLEAFFVIGKENGVFLITFCAGS